jgi:hypothetical protein
MFSESTSFELRFGISQAEYSMPSPGEQDGSTFLEVITILGSQPSTKIARGRDDRAPTAIFGTARDK